MMKALGNVLLVFQKRDSDEVLSTQNVYYKAPPDQHPWKGRQKWGGAGKEANLRGRPGTSQLPPQVVWELECL